MRHMVGSILIIRYRSWCTLTFQKCVKKGKLCQNATLKPWWMFLERNWCSGHRKSSNPSSYAWRLWGRSPDQQWHSWRLRHRARHLLHVPGESEQMYASGGAGRGNRECRYTKYKLFNICCTRYWHTHIKQSPMHYRAENTQTQTRTFEHTYDSCKLLRMHAITHAQINHNHAHTYICVTTQQSNTNKLRPTHAYAHIYIYTYTHTKQVHTHIHTYTQTYVRTHALANMNTKTNTYIHTQTHTLDT